MNESAIDDLIWSTLSRFTERLEAATAPEQVLVALVESAEGLLPFTACALALPSPWRVWRATRVTGTEVLFIFNENHAIPAEAAQTLSRFINMDQPLLVVDDLLSPPWSDSSHRDVLWKDGTRSALLVPLTASGVTIGALSFTSIQPNQYLATPHDLVRLLGWMIANRLRLLADSEKERKNED